MPPPNAQQMHSHFALQPKTHKAETSVSFCAEQISRTRFCGAFTEVRHARREYPYGRIFVYRTLEASSKERLNRKPLLPFEVEKICQRYTSDLLDLSDLDCQLKTLDKRFRRVEIPDVWDTSTIFSQIMLKQRCFRCPSRSTNHLREWKLNWMTMWGGKG